LTRIVLAVMLAGCRAVTYVDPSALPSGIVVSQRGHYFAGGLIGHTDIDVRALCPQGAARVTSSFTALDLLLTAITLDVYTPRTYAIECAR
jgi:hypothetical protein